MEEIDLKELFTYFLKKVGLIIAIVAFFVLIGTIYAMFIKVPMYKSNTSIILATNTDSTQTITTNDVTLNKNLVDTYTEIIKSRRILNKVIDNLELDIDYQTLGEAVSVSALSDTEIIQVTVVDENPEIAKALANEIADVFSNEIWTLYNVNNVNVLDEAQEATSAYNINLLKDIVIFFAIGLVLSFGLVFVLFYFDRTIKSVEQLESKFNVPILGSIQELGKGDVR